MDKDDKVGHKGEATQASGRMRPVIAVQVWVS